MMFSQVANFAQQSLDIPKMVTYSNLASWQFHALFYSKVQLLPKFKLKSVFSISSSLAESGLHYDLVQVFLVSFNLNFIQ